ncbi:restriction endonuclease subunit S [Nitrincola iocasae]|uniref:Type I restriction modification DNA specificity domain-containing protein n=1 Tax=Nitrincola iocasae TaxID=2614693 RepID=A0A5J6LHH1_9GAMM|nr:restriction endonuclease subunit S [Nitrincola iocasae]QEW08004.1 hypothetical protein F5I99_16740 [Nitrincola iocasae]
MSEKQALVPRLRFPEFQDSGEWVEKPIGDIGEVVTGNTPSTTNREYYGGDIMFASPADISEHRFVSKTSKTLSSHGLANARKIPALSILFVCIGSTIGKVAQNANYCATNQQINSIVPFNGYVKNFIYYALYFYSTKIAALAGKQAVPIINKSLFSSSSILVPSKKEEQQKIADCLSSLDELLAAQSDKIDVLKTHKKGLMQQLFPREGETIPRLRFPEFRDTEEWEEKLLGNMLSIGNGRDHKHLPDGDIPVYGTGGYMRSVNDYLYEGESVCIGRKGTIDKPVFLVGKFWTVDTLFYTYAFKKCLPRFVYSIFQNIDWKKHNEAGGVPSLSKANIEKIKVAVPGIKEQQKIADCLSSLDALITAQTEKIDALKTHKKGLMQQLFPSMDEVEA